MNKEDQAYAKQLDDADPLRLFRQRFALPTGQIYLDGNSLGPLMTSVQERLHEAIAHEWGNGLIGSWNDGWIDLPTRVAKKIAPLIGAAPENVICADSVSVNLFKLIATALQLNPSRRRILSLDSMFPTDLYMAQGMSQLLGHEKCELISVTEEQLEPSLDPSINLLIMSEVDFRSGKRYDIESITRLAHDEGVMVLWDLSHSVGIRPIELESWEVDFAVGCGYKYLNGGPGAPAFLTVAEQHQNKVQQPLSGWMGHKQPFNFEQDYEAAAGISQYLCGTPPILSLSALDAALDIWQAVDLHQVYEKSTAITELFIEQVRNTPSLKAFELVTPAVRGSQVTVYHREAFSICQALIADGIICDYREPGLLRFGFAPLYIRYQDVLQAISVLDAIMRENKFIRPEYQHRQSVT